MRERSPGRRRWRLVAGTAVVATVVALVAALSVAVPGVGAQGAFARLSAAFDTTPERDADRLDFRHLGTEQGLPSDVVNAVAQDALGFVWIGTPEGLVRYDGAEMRPFRHSGTDAATVPGNVITAIAATARPRGGLYVGTTDGLARYSPSREAFTRIGGLPTDDVTALATDADGGAWVGLRGGGLAYVAPDSARARTVPLGAAGPANTTVFAVLVDAEGKVWVGTERGVVRVRVPRTRDPAQLPRARLYGADSLSLAPVSSLARRADGSLYVGTQGTGLWRLDPATGAYTSVPLGVSGPSAVTSVHEDASGTVWVGMLGNGLRRLAPNAAPAGYVHRDDALSSLADDDVSAVFEDRQGVLWVATYGGLSRTDLGRSAARRLRADPADPAALASNTVHAVLPTDSLLYVGTERSLDVSADGTHFRHTVFGIDGGRPEHPVMALLRGRDGTVWAGTRGAGLYRMGANGPDRVPVRTGGDVARPQLSVLALAESPDGRALWLGTEADGLVRHDLASGASVAYRHDPARAASLAADEVRALALAPDGGVWAGTTGGLCRLVEAREPGAFACSARDGEAGDGLPALANDDVNALVFADGTLWIGTKGGLFGLDPQRPEAGVRAFTAATSDLPGDAVYGIAEGAMGLLWLSTSGGLVRFDPGTAVFTPRLGRVGAGPGFGRAIAWADTLLYAGGSGGLLRVNPADLKETNPNPPQAVITGVDVGGRAVVPGGEASPLAVAASVADVLHLDADQDFVTFRFAGLHFSDPSAITYRFRLTGEHDDWRNAGTRREATYTNLAPGRYTFEVVARTSDGVDSAPATLGVTVRPPWYRTWWAYAAFLALAGLAVWQVGRWQQQRLLRREREAARQREAELRAETAEAERRKAEAETERQRAEAVALKAQHDRTTAELERTRDVDAANAKLEAANVRLETSLRDLQATQAQLVQSEKLASLGQLTAGIAHEIKNPLNFVNNFADLSVELVGDIETDLRADPARPVGEALADVEDLFSDLRDNARRIREHGQRADRIVRSMLLHSRGGAVERARVDVNRYVDEYANLAYHGARANNSDFNLTLVRDFADDAGEVEVVPQEFGRVLINLLTNAFHAVHARALASGRDYQPAVTLSTRRDGDAVVVSIADNGTGIPAAVRERIFEPFFTTKPTGEGTGLGLSLVHDIVTQVHGGSVAVESAEGAGTTFTIRLPDAPPLVPVP